VDVLYLFLVLNSQSDLEGTTPDFNFLTAACGQDQMDLVIGFFLFGGDAIGLSVATRYRAFKFYAPTCNLVTTIESPL
jgi:hypothetical protein